MHLLVVTPDDRDWASLESVFAPSNWVLHRVTTPAEAAQFCRQYDPAVVLCSRDVAGGGWRGMLELLRNDAVSAPMVVFARDADEHLWSEVLAAGGYDVLVVPFDKHEVFRIATQAWRQWHRRHPRTESVAVTAAAGH
jgi:DNA-binding NtrC family response regulator